MPKLGKDIKGSLSPNKRDAAPRSDPRGTAESESGAESEHGNYGPIEHVEFMCAESFLRAAQKMQKADIGWLDATTAAGTETLIGRVTGPVAPEHRACHASSSSSSLIRGTSESPVGASRAISITISRAAVTSRIITADGMSGAKLHDVVHVGHGLTPGAVIAIDGSSASVHLHAPSEGLRIGDPVTFVAKRCAQEGAQEGVAGAHHLSLSLPPPSFKPAYEIWLEPPPGWGAPKGFVLRGLEWRYEPTKQCRLPAKWELNVVDVSAGIDWRYYPVTRRTCGLELRRGLARHLERTLERVVLMLDGKPVRDAATAEELDLFTRMEDLRVEHCQPWWMTS